MAKRKQTENSRPGRLRIVAGNWRSRLLDVADVPGLRPTSQRIRETLFNWLTTHLPGAHCLDLFAGTGALGLEALSRGAGSVVFVEQSATAAATLRDNIALLDATGASVIAADATSWLRGEHGGPFDIVFLDPPFAADLLDDLCRLMEQQNVLADHALIYLEQDKARPEPRLPGGWRLLRNKTAGNVRYMLVRREANEEHK